MIPTEHEGTVAVDAAARSLYERMMAEARAGGFPMPRDIPDFDDLDALSRNRWREQALPFVWAALSALPDRRREGWEAGLQAGIDAAATVPHRGMTYAIPDNPYPAETVSVSLEAKYAADPVNDEVRQLAIDNPSWSGAETLCWREHTPGRVCILPATHIEETP